MMDGKFRTKYGVSNSWQIVYDSQVGLVALIYVLLCRLRLRPLPFFSTSFIFLPLVLDLLSPGCGLDNSGDNRIFALGIPNRKF